MRHGYLGAALAAVLACTAGAAGQPAAPAAGPAGKPADQEVRAFPLNGLTADQLKQGLPGVWEKVAGRPQPGSTAVPALSPR